MDIGGVVENSAPSSAVTVDATAAGYNEQNESNMDTSATGSQQQVDAFPDGSMTASTSVVDEKINPDSLKSVLGFLQKHGLKDAEEALVKAARKVIPDVDFPSTPVGAQEAGSSFSTNLQSHTDFDSNQTQDEKLAESMKLVREYESLVNFCEMSLDKYKPELSSMLFPLFAHIYMELVAEGYVRVAKKVLRRFGPVQAAYWQQQIAGMNRITSHEQISANTFLNGLKTEIYQLRLSKPSLTHLKPFLQEHTTLQAWMHGKIKIEPIDGNLRSKEAVEAVSGGFMGEAAKSANKTRVYYGVPKADDDNDSTIGGTPLFGGGGDHSTDGENRKKKKRDKEKKKGDPHAPAFDRIPLPEWSDSQKQIRREMRNELQKAVKISSSNPPSVCFFTLLNAKGGVSSVDLSEDSQLIAAGYGSSAIELFTVGPEQLKSVKPFAKLETMDHDADDIYEQMLDANSGVSSLSFYGHSGPVYGVHLNFDKRLMISCSEDSTVRLWSTQLRSNLCIYRVGGYPIWDVKFSPRGYYFATAGSDRMVLLWTTDKLQPLRIMADHFSDVNCVEFHPNCNYLVSGSEDRTIRLWDIRDGNSVRYFTGHKSGVHGVKFSPDGKYVASCSKFLPLRMQ